jgi:hypothetical protein
MIEDLVVIPNGTMIAAFRSATSNTETRGPVVATFHSTTYNTII